MKRCKSAIFLALALLLSYSLFEAPIHVWANPASTTLSHSVGVKVGDWVKYGVFNATWVSEDPDAQPPWDLELWTSIDWIKTLVTAIFGTNVTFDLTIRFKNGTEMVNAGSIDVETGWGSLPFYFIAANLSAGDPLYSGGPFFGAINETLVIDYLGLARETNHMNLTRFYTDYPLGWKNASESYNIYWDRSSGVLTEESYQRSYLSGAKDYKTFEYVSFKISDTNVWTSAPSEPIRATILMFPRALNLKSQGKWMLCFIKLPKGYNVADINVSTIRLNSTIPIGLRFKPVGDIDFDGTSEMMIVFNRTQVIQYIQSSMGIRQSGMRFASVTLTVTGKLYNGTSFMGSTKIGIIRP